MLLAFDDTDGPEGGCTTRLVFHVLAALPELALRGLPRLVRLNPNIPWKTRGNGALVVPLGLPEGPQVRVGELRGLEVLAFPEGRPVQPTADLLDRAWAAIRSAAEPGSQPSCAAVARPLPAPVYDQAVKAVVRPGEARAALADAGALDRTSPSAMAAAGEAAPSTASSQPAEATGRALAGCAGALAWPGPPTSYELIAYREPGRCGTPRQVDPAPLLRLDATGTTFHTSDPDAGRPVCVPHGPDPVLLGIRGRDPDVLRAVATTAIAQAAKEPVDGWLLFATNQASGDHVTPVASIADSPELGTVELDCVVGAMPSTGRGGHAAVELLDLDGLRLRALAFEPTHGLREVVRGLRKGDAVTVVGAVKDGAVNLEKLRVRRLADVAVRVNPDCPKCRRRTRSRGPSTGFRCPECGEKLPPSAVRMAAEERTVALGWHEVPVMARRHLHRPVAWA